MKKDLIFLLIFLCCHCESTSAETLKKEKVLPYKNPKLSIEQRVEDLLGRMTLEEKVYQLCAELLGEGDEIFQSSGSYSMDNIRERFGQHGVGHLSCPTTDMPAEKAIPTANRIQKIAIEETRLGIPVIMDAEALHGCRALGATSYPQSIALGCTWDLELMSEVADAIGQETYYRGINQVLSPTLDLARDPRHGRMEECYSEDPFLATRMGVEFIKGVQKNGVICSPKHFLANFVAEGGRDSGNVGLSERELRELHMVPYEAAVKEAGVKSLMAGYNTIDGVPCSSNRWLLTDVLRKEWGFNGFVVSDWSGVYHAYGTLKVAPTMGEAAALCVKAGLDVDLPRIRAYATLGKMVEEGKLTEKELDENVRHILRVKFQMGLFEKPYIDEKQGLELRDNPQFRSLARKAARESIVLLKNEKNTLPLTSARKIAVIGPNANVLQLGGYSANGVKGATPLEGLKNQFGSSKEFIYAKGCELTGNDKSKFAEAVAAAQEAELCLLFMGGRNGATGGETRDRNNLDLMGVQEDLILEIAKTGKPVVVVLVDGRPVTMSHWMDKADAIVMMFFAGEEGGNALAEILSGKVNPSGKLSVSFPKQTGDIPMCLYHRPYGREGNIIGQKIPKSRYFPQFPLGYGLSYTSYQYKNMRMPKSNYKKGEPIEVSIDITNTGTMDGDEIVQLYLTDLVCRITQSEKRLKGFQRIHIPAGETRTVTFTLPYSELSFLNERLEPEVEPGEFEVSIGTNCLDINSLKFNIE